MDTYSYGNAMPWFIDPAYLMRMVEMSVSVVALLVVAGLVYAGLFHLLCNRTDNRSIRSWIPKFGWSAVVNIANREGLRDEA